MKSFRCLSPLLCAALLTWSVGAQADMVVVVNARAGIEQMAPEEIINIFLGRYRRLPNGASAVPIDQPANSDMKAEFYRRLVNKSLNEINAYWSRLVFSGKTKPPQNAASSSEVIKLLTSTPGAIAYIERNQVDSRLRVVLELAP